MAQESLMPAINKFQDESISFDKSKKRDFMSQISRYLFYKKRFENRSLQITSHLKLSVVPGFNVLLLDDSDAEQSTLAYCSSVTHRIYATEGGYTNVQLSYARTTEEEAVVSGKANEPIVPPWFDPKIFGSFKTTTYSQSAEKAGVSLTGKGEIYVNPPEDTLSDYYKELLGAKGYEALTGRYEQEPTVIGAVRKLIDEYRTKKEQGSEILQTFIAAVTGRDYIRIRDSFAFFGASLNKNEDNTVTTNTTQTSTTDLRLSSFNVFKGGAFDADNPDYAYSLKKKMEVIQKYRDALKTYRGFRG
jgi:hypothetical protein